MPKQTNKLLAGLKKLRSAVEQYGNTELRSALMGELDEVIVGLSDLRKKLADGPEVEGTAGILSAVDEVVQFLGRAQSNDAFKFWYSPAIARRPRKRQGIDIPPNLTNEQIRALLERDLKKSELEEIASQRSISLSKRSKIQLRSAIVDFIERQEGYEQLRR